MTPVQTRLARRRLGLGIVNVGTWVLAATAGLWWLTTGADAPVGPHHAAVFVLAALGVQAIFDFVGGVLLMPPPRPGVAHFLRDWLRGVIGQTLVLTLIVALSWLSLRLSGGFVAGILAGTLGLALGRTGCLRLVGGVSFVRQPVNGGETLLAGAADPAFTGGAIGLGNRAVSLWPASWQWRVSADEQTAEESRRQWQAAGGLPLRTLGLVLAWNALGSALGTFLFHPVSHPPTTALLLHTCWMTLWTFGSLLMLPSLSRSAVFAADRAALDAGHDPRAWIARLPDLVGEDGGSGPLVQTIFYPVPSAKRRLGRLEASPGPGFVPGNLARANLYYSWAGCTLLGRAVHCNVGRPSLWVFPPSA